MFKAKVIREPETIIEGIPELMDDEHPSENLLAETGTDTERVERLAYEKGFKEGERAGYEVGLKKAEALIERLNSAIIEIEKYRNALHQSLQEKVLSLTMAVARRIIKEEIKSRKDLMVELIKEAVKRIEPSETLLIRLHPSLRDIIEKMNNIESLHESIKIEIDPALTDVSARVSTSEQDVPLDVDFLVEGLMEQLKEKLLSNETGNSRGVD